MSFWKNKPAHREDGREGFLAPFRQKVVATVLRKTPESSGVPVDDKIALGVLLLAVARADAKFLPEEEDRIRQTLKDFARIPDKEMDYVLAAIEQARRESIDLFIFTHEVSRDLRYDVKKDIIENLFRVACADGELANEEHETIRKISGLFGLGHGDFIDAKIKVKKEFGLDTAGL